VTLRKESETWARIYDDSTVGAEAYVFRRSSAVALAMVGTLRKPGQRWLDLGCGPAHATAQLDGGGLVVGADADEAQLRVARNRNPDHRFSLLAARAEHLPFGNGQLDGLMAISLMGCLPDPEPSWAEVARVLRPGGVAVMTFTNRASLLLRLNYLLPRRWITSSEAGSSNQTYRLFGEREIRSGLERHGFTVEHVSFYNHVLHIGRWLIPPRNLAPLLDARGFSRLARNILIVARKRAGR